MSTWHWVAPAVLYAIHDRQLAEHGGQEGNLGRSTCPQKQQRVPQGKAVSLTPQPPQGGETQDINAIESALARPQQLLAYGNPDAAALAAAYAFGLSRNHGFVDGNKRVAWVVARLFLADNGFQLSFKAVEAVRLMEALAAGNIEESQLAQWFRERLEKVAEK